MHAFQALSRWKWISCRRRYKADALRKPRPQEPEQRSPRRMERADNDLSGEEWVTIKAMWGGCAYCGADDADLQKDCVQPISRGGRYTLDNVVPACRSCNASKCNHELTTWMRRKRLDEAAFLLRQAEIAADLAG